MEGHNKVIPEDNSTSSPAAFREASDREALRGHGHDTTVGASDGSATTLFGKPLGLIRDFLLWENWTDGTLMSLKVDIFAGVTLALTQIAPSVAYAIIGGSAPNDGLRVSAILTIGCSIFGGRPGMLTAAAGAVAPLLPEFSELHGPEALAAVAFCMGVFTLLLSAAGFARYVRVVPTPVMLGFLDGLGITLAMKQIKRFQLPDGQYATGGTAAWMAFICIVSFATMMILPRFSHAVPSAFMAVVVGTVIEQILRATGHGTVTIKDLYNLSGSFAQPRHPPIDYSDSALISETVTTAVVVTVSGCFESFLCMHLINRATKTPGNFRREGMTLGAMNILNGFLHGFPGCAVIGPSLLNVDMGAATRRVSAFLCGVLIMVVYLVASPAVDLIPAAALAAVIFGIAVKTFAWQTLEMIFLMRIPLADSLVIVVTVVMSLLYDLAVGVGVGFATASFFAMGSIAVAHGAHGWVQAPVRVASSAFSPTTRQSPAIPTIADLRRHSQQQEEHAHAATEPTPSNPLHQQDGGLGATAAPAAAVVGASSMREGATGCVDQKPTASVLAEATQCIRRQIRHVHLPLKGMLFFGTSMHFEDTIFGDVADLIAFAQNRGSDDGSNGNVKPTTADDADASLTTITDVVLDAQDGEFMIRDFTAADALREVAVELMRMNMRCHLVAMDAISLSIMREAKRLGHEYDLLLVPQLKASTSKFNHHPGDDALPCHVHIRRVADETPTVAEREEMQRAAPPPHAAMPAAGALALSAPHPSSTSAPTATPAEPPQGGADNNDDDTFVWRTNVLFALPTAGPFDENPDGHLIFAPVEFPWHLMPHARAIVTHFERKHAEKLQRDLMYGSLEELDRSDSCLVVTALVSCFNMFGLGHRAIQAVRPLTEAVTRVCCCCCPGGHWGCCKGGSDGDEGHPLPACVVLEGEFSRDEKVRISHTTRALVALSPTAAC